MKLLVSTKKQFKMYLDDDLVQTLKSAADRFGRGSGQEVAEDVLNIYLPVWRAVNEAAQRAIDYQVKQLAETGGSSLLITHIVRDSDGIMTDETADDRPARKKRSG